MADPAAAGASPVSSVGLGSASEKNAGGGAPATGTAASTASSAPVKQRSCLTCRQRKVRCDKASPCSNCRRADIACVFPSTDRPPRWARRLRAGLGGPQFSSQQQQQQQQPQPQPHVRPAAADGLSPATGAGGSINAVDAGLVIERLRHLENLVRELTSKPRITEEGSERTSGGGDSTAQWSDKVGGASVEDETRTSSQSPVNQVPSPPVMEQFGRLVLDETSRSRYVSSGFWSRVNDELDELRAETRSLAGESVGSEEDYWEGPRNSEINRAPSDRTGFLFGHNLRPRASGLHEFRPLPSQVPFLFQTFVDNINCLIQIVHAPTVSKLIRGMAGSNPEPLSLANEALMFAIYYAAITSMEEEDVTTNFGASKADLSIRYRLGLEHALAEADFLNVLDLALLQAFMIFLALVRRHDSPRFVWMMTGLAIRMGQALGLQRDGTSLGLPPFQTEIRRRVWWALCGLDVRTSEDQGTELSIHGDTFDTRLPLHIDDSDLSEDMTEPPTERTSLCSMTYASVSFELVYVTRRMMGPAGRRRDEAALTVDQQARLLNDVYDRIQGYYLVSGPSSSSSIKLDDVVYWVAVTVLRMVIAKMTLVLYLPTLSSLSAPALAPTTDVSASAAASLRARLLACAIEVAEYNHALNAEPSCRHWRWLFQTYTQWHAIAYLLVEMVRRPWSPTVERAWVALHSRYLIPDRADMNARSLRAWIPLRKLMTKARRYRAAELDRLRADKAAARALDADDAGAAVPGPARGESYAPLSNPTSANLFRERWRNLIAAPAAAPTPAPVFASLFPTGPSSSSSPSSSSQAPQVSQGGLSFGVMGGGGGGSRSAAGGTPRSFSGQGSDFGGMATGGASLGAGPSLRSTPPTMAGEPVIHVSPPPPPQLAQGYPVGYQMAGAATTAAPSSHAGSDVQNHYSVPWLWADADPSTDVFGGMDMEGTDVDMDMDGEVDWQNWFESVRGLDGGGDMSGFGQGW